MLEHTLLILALTACVSAVIISLLGQHHCQQVPTSAAGWHRSVQQTTSATLNKTLSC
jgi:hypothetical protein